MSEHVPKSILVTGGAGFIGSNFVDHMLRTNADIRLVNLDKLTYAGSLEHLDAWRDEPRHRFVRGDICDTALVESLFAEHGFDTVVHFAAETHVDRSITGPAPFIRTNFEGTFTLLETARKSWRSPAQANSEVRFLAVSTDEVYGSVPPDAPPCTEESPYRPSSPYAASKAASDHIVRAYHRTFGLPTIVTQCSNNYGPHQHPEKFLPTVIRACAEGRPIPIYGDGSNRRDWLHVADHCRALELVVRRGAPGDTFNIGGDNEVSNIDVATKLCSIFDERRPECAPHATLLQFVTDRPGHDWRYAVSSKKLHARFGWEPTEDFDAGLRGTIEWYLRRPKG